MMYRYQPLLLKCHPGLEKGRNPPEILLGIVCYRVNAYCDPFLTLANPITDCLSPKILSLHLSLEYNEGKWIALTTRDSFQVYLKYP
jgi:hypothetical protein